MTSQRPGKQGLYDPAHEHDACGIGLVVHVRGQASNAIVRDGLTALSNLIHRGAVGAEPNTGDGAGILLQIPHRFLRRVCAEQGISLPEAGRYAVGSVFLPQAEAQAERSAAILEDAIREQGQTVLGWRDVPTDPKSLGPRAQACMPRIRQVFIGRSADVSDDQAFERKLYIIRRSAEGMIRRPEVEGGQSFYCPSFSSRTLCYKGMLITEQLEGFYPDLSEPDVESALALVHSRFSTNTFPSWDRAHPYRYIMHNGEINTLRGNINWMHARQSMLASDVFGDALPRCLPVIDPDGSDSAMFDNCLEFLVLAGYSLPHAVAMMIPEPWAHDPFMEDARKAFYEFHSCLMEPWDGPAAIAFTDGTRVGAMLDRNGLRPSRYYVTKDDVVILASEVGVLDIPPERILRKGRLRPGRMLLIDTQEGRIVDDAEIKGAMAAAQPYRAWLDDNCVQLENLPEPQEVAHSDRDTLLERQQAFGYTFEDLRLLLAPMAQSGVEPVGSMGNDTPLAVLSDKPRLLYDYFKQLFAQVTNPPIDALREEVITSSDVLLGSEGNLLRPVPESCRRVRLPLPVLTNADLAKLREIDRPGLRARTLPILFPAGSGGPGLERAMEELFAAATAAIEDGVTILILSDRGVDAGYAPIPALLAVAGLHHHLIGQGTRTRAGIVLESGEPREVHHVALLVGYGCGAVNPYLAYETLEDMIAQGLLADIDAATATRNLTKALAKGVVKTMSKMGISTIQSYCGAQIFEAVGLNEDLIDRYFTWTPSRISGVGTEQVAEDAQRRHRCGYPDRPSSWRALDPGGQYQWRKDGESHLFNPLSIHTLQEACRAGDYEVFVRYARLIDDQSERLCTLRGLLGLRSERPPVPIDEVETIEAICKRFTTGAMSYGSLSQEAHECLAIAMNRLGGKSNTGEGGEDSARFATRPDGDSSNSAIKQVASGRFGVTSEYLVSAQELQIKMAQGAKPGEGGQLPGGKVYPWIARVRHSTPGVGLISPPPHHDIYSIEDLAELIHDLKNANRDARISVKLVAEVGVGTVAAGVAKARSDVILISGHDGGTGASPYSSIKHAGLPWELGLAEAHQTLLLNDLRSRVVLETDGQLKTGRDVVIAALLGAEEFGFATAPLVAMGCIMMRACNKDTCPVGVATQNPELRKNFRGRPEHVANFMRFIAQQVREIMAELGFRTVEEMVGRVECLEPQRAVDHYKARGLDFSRILYAPDVPETVARYHRIPQQHGIEKSLDVQVLLDLCRPAIERGERVEASLPIRNTHRVVGTIVGSEITKRWGGQGLPEDTIVLRFAGSAGQSFGAFIPRGMTLMLEGDSNDYVGKGLSGGKIIVSQPVGSTFAPEENIIIGNVAFYGATSGEAYIHGMAGERFCVRNSGLDAVVEAVGDHGCEYMTGGRVIVLGAVGWNFAAGMSGGIAYLLDPAGNVGSRVNTGMVELHALEDPEEIGFVRTMVERHVGYTGSELGRRVLDDFDALVGHFAKVLPTDYARMLACMKRVQEQGLTGDEAVMAAFEENKRDLARTGGN